MPGSSQRGTKRKSHGKDHGKRPPSRDLKVLPCQQEDKIFTKWDQVRDEIVKAIDLTHVDKIGCNRVGESYSPRRTKPTILVCSDHAKHPKTVEKSLKIINEVLKEHDLSDVRVEFFEGQTSRHADNDETNEEGRTNTVETGVFDRRVVQSPSMPGQALSLQENTQSSGTLGGFFEIKFANGTRKVVAVTCFHVLNPTEAGKTRVAIATIRRWRKFGIVPNDRISRNFTVYHPSSRAIQEKRAALEEDIKKIDNSDHRLSGVLVTNDLDIRPTERTKYLKNEKELSYLRGFLDDVKDFDPKFGSVWAASGFRTRQGAHGKLINCDWVLVEVPADRLSSNVTPRGHVLKGSPLPDKLDNLRLCLSGQRSGYTEGDYYSLRDANVAHEMIDGIVTSVPTVEHTVIASGTEFQFFAQPGDSGSLVYTRRGHVLLGLLFAGRPDIRTANFTHIEDLIADIKKIAGATEVRLR